MEKIEKQSLRHAANGKFNQAGNRNE